MKRFFLILILSLFVLSACVPEAEPTPTPDDQEATETPVPEPTDTPQPDLEVEEERIKPPATRTATLTATKTPNHCFTLIEPLNNIELPQTGLVRFIWSSQQGAVNYQLEIILPNGVVEIYETNQEYFDKYLASFPLGGEYRWLVKAFDEEEQEICFTLPSTFKKEQTILIPDTNGTTGGNEDEEEVSSDSCFLAGTLILMGDQSTQPIEEVQVGDTVMGYDFETGKLKKAQVLEIESPLREAFYVVKMENGNSLQITGEHPIYIQKNGWKGWGAIEPKQVHGNSFLDVEQLEIGAFAMNADGEWSQIVDIARADRVVRTFNLSKVSSTNVFFANGWLVHNKGGDEGGDDEE